MEPTCWAEIRTGTIPPLASPRLSSQGRASLGTNPLRQVALFSSSFYLSTVEDGLLLSYHVGLMGSWVQRKSTRGSTQRSKVIARTRTRPLLMNLHEGPLVLKNGGLGLCAGTKYPSTRRTQSLAERPEGLGLILPSRLAYCSWLPHARYEKATAGHMLTRGELSPLKNCPSPHLPAFFQALAFSWGSPIISTLYHTSILTADMDCNLLNATNGHVDENELVAAAAAVVVVPSHKNTGVVWVNAR